MIGDPYDVLAPGVVRHPLRPLLRTLSTRTLRRQCREAAAVAYETERRLQLRYPTLPTTPTAGISSVDLPPAAFVPHARPLRQPPAEPTLVSVGSLEQLYKGIDTLISALALMPADGPRARLVHVGVGAYRPHLEQLAARSGVAGRVSFTGPLPDAEAVRRTLDSADLFVMPSRTEGLPGRSSRRWPGRSRPWVRPPAASRSCSNRTAWCRPTTRPLSPPPSPRCSPPRTGWRSPRPATSAGPVTSPPRRSTPAGRRSTGPSPRSPPAGRGRRSPVALRSGR
ncbi:glycosyltransferase [Micromonospora sp. BRA006-A]|nr:glycosyltransferase [Micromonospora sp. BRA006-A]